MKEIIIGYNEHESGSPDPLWIAWEQTGELVRCKDCKYSHIMTSNPRHPKVNKCWCEKDFIEGWHEPDWFCADGERKD